MNLLQFDSTASWIDGVTAFWRDRLRLNPELRMCLASGQTPNPIYAAMASAVREKQVSFRRATAFALDEFGGLEPDDAGRCSNMIRRQLVDHIDLPVVAFFTLDPEATDLSCECRRYESAIVPGFDLALLGIGLNGHLGLNEPGSSPESGVRRMELHEETVVGSARYVSRGNLPRWGLTVGLSQILASREVWVLANGKSKAAIIQRTVCGEIDPSVPATLLRRHPRFTLFVDADAGRLI